MKLFRALPIILSIALFTSCNSEDDATACIQTATYTTVPDANKLANKTTCDLTNLIVHRDIPDATLELNKFHLIDLGFYYDEFAPDGKTYGNRWKFVNTFPIDYPIEVEYVLTSYGIEIGVNYSAYMVGNMDGHMELEFTTFMVEEPYGKPRTYLFIQNALGNGSTTPIYGDPLTGGTPSSVGIEVPVNIGDIKITDINTCVVTYRTQDTTPTTAVVECSACGTTVIIGGVNYLIECN